MIGSGGSTLTLWVSQHLPDLEEIVDPTSF